MLNAWAARRQRWFARRQHGSAHRYSQLGSAALSPSRSRGGLLRFPIGDLRGSRRASSPRGLVGKDGEQFANPMVAIHGMAQWLIGMQPVAVPSSHPLPVEIPRFLELHHDPLRCPFGDPHRSSDVAEPDLPIPCDAQQHMRVIGQERPFARPGKYRCGDTTRHTRMVHRMLMAPRTSVFTDRHGREPGRSG